MNRPTTALELLTKARDLISDPTKWTQGASYKDENGKDCEKAIACSFCTLGALNYAYEPVQHIIRWNAVQEAANAIMWRTVKENAEEQFISTFNDNHTHVEVLAMFDLAIKNAKELQNAS